MKYIRSDEDVITQFIIIYQRARNSENNEIIADENYSRSEAIIVKMKNCPMNRSRLYDD